jgi:hypothetical protein
MSMILLPSEAALSVAESVPRPGMLDLMFT